MKKFCLYFIIFINLFFINLVNADSENINPSIKKAYEAFEEKVEKKYNTQKQLEVFKNLNLVLEKALKKFQKDEFKKDLIGDLKYLNNEKLKKIELRVVLFEKAKRELEEKNKLIENEKKFNLIYNKNLDSSFLSKNVLLKDFKFKSTNNDNIFIENGIWYYYKIGKYKYFTDLQYVKEIDFEANGIYLNKSLVFKNTDGIISFTNDYKKIKLIDDNILYGIVNKYNFLLEIKDDKEFIFTETDNYFKNLKNITTSLTDGKNENEKIKEIYKYILDNYEYTKIINLDNKEIFSGIELYKNKNGVCEAYVKLFMYMLNFAGIDNVEILRGYVIDAQDFPDIGHAWVRIGNKYYDPTFDDPVGLKNTRLFDEYMYFGLPKDLFYTNRYDYDEIPENLKSKSLDFRKELILIKQYNLYEKYKLYNYNIFKEVAFRIKNNIKYDEKITLSNLEKVIPIYEVKDFRFNKNGKNIYIKKINYYTINDKNIKILLEQLNYNLDGYYYFKWYNEDGNYEYRLGYNLEI